MAVRFGSSGIQGYSVAAGLPTGDFTLLMWVNLQAVNPSDYTGIFHMVASGGDLICEAADTTSAFSYRVASIDSSTATIGTGTWTAMVFTRSGTGHVMRYGTNPNSLTSITANTASSGTVSTLYLGLYGPAEEVFNGRIANVKLFGAVLTAAEMSTELQFYVPERTTNLTHWYPWVNPDTTDYSGNGRTLSLVGTGQVVGDGPPIRWSRPRGRYVNLAGVPIENAPFAIAGQQAVTNVLVNADCANISVTANDALARLTSTADAAALSVDSQQAARAAGVLADAATWSVAGQNATSGIPTNPTATNAAPTVTAQDAKVSVSPASDYSFLSVETLNAIPPASPTDILVPSTTLVPSTSLPPRGPGIEYSPIDLAAQTALAFLSLSAGLSSVAMTAQDAKVSIGGLADAALIAVDAQGAYVGTPTLASAGVATVTAAAQDTTPLVQPIATESGFLLESRQAGIVQQAPVPSLSLVPSTTLVPNTTQNFVSALADVASLSATAQSAAPVSRANADAAAVTVAISSTSTPGSGFAQADVAVIAVIAYDAGGSFIGQGRSPTSGFNPRKLFTVPVRGYRRA